LTVYLKKEPQYPQIEFELIQIEKNYGGEHTLFVRNRTLFVVGRNKKTKEKRIFFINDFYPRFYVQKQENMDFVLEQNKDVIKDVKSKEDGEEYNYFDSKLKNELLTIYLYDTSKVQDLREYFSQTYEANIKFTDVFRREKLIKENFFVYEYVLKMEERHYKINGIDYIMTKEKELDGGDLIF
jgi:hypothetical protein